MKFMLFRTAIQASSSRATVPAAVAAWCEEMDTKNPGATFGIWS